MTDEPVPASPPRADVCLILNRQVIPLRQGTVRLGRLMDNDVVLQEEVISRNHAEIRCENDRFILYDLGSTGGTYVNSRRVDRCQLNSGDIVSLATMQLMFVDNSAGLFVRARSVTQSLAVDPGGEAPAPKAYTILIVDDEPGLLIGLAALMKRKGYKVVTAANGTDALETVRKERPDLILSDVMMPAPNGFEIKKQLSLDPQLAKIPFIFLTARIGNEDRIAGIREGADDYITKPFDRDELMARIEAVFRRVETEQERGREEARTAAQQEMDRQCREILQNIQHELRTPLMNVMMPLELAVSHKFENPEEQLKFIRVAFSNLERLESLITDMILLTDIDQSRLNHVRQPLDVSSNLVKPINKRLERYQDKQLKLALDASAAEGITAPRREFAQAVLHLADNAFKFSPPGGVVQLTVRRIGRDGAQVDVLDQGPGVPKDLQEKVFERFYQISQGDMREYEGLGLGLTIARAVAERVGGTARFLETPAGCHLQLVIPESQAEGQAGHAG